MARMSIDDMFLRDPRVLKLARRLGWSKYETRGRLLDVFALVYDRVDAGAGELITEDDIDIASDFPGLGEAMVNESLAVRVRDRVRICGASERTRYLATREESGRAGGIKSGETRRNKAKVKAKVPTKVTFEKNEGRSNPSVPDPVPDLVPDPVPEEISLSRARAIPPDPGPTTTPPTEPVAPTLAQRQKINHDVWAAAKRAHDQLRATVDRNAQAWGAMPMGPGGDELAARTKELGEQLGTEAAVRDVHDRVIAVRVVEAKKLGHLKFFIPTRVYDRDSFWKSAELSPQQAAQTDRMPARPAEPREVRVVRDYDDDAPPPEHPAFRRKA